MKIKLERFSIARIAAVPMQAEPGTAAGGAAEPAVAERTSCGRRRRYAGSQSRRLKELKHLQNENTRLKKLVTELRLDKSILENVARLCSAGKLSS
jgi:putative transposase